MIKSGELVYEVAKRYGGVSALESVPDAALVGASASVIVLTGASASVRRLWRPIVRWRPSIPTSRSHRGTIPAALPLLNRQHRAAQASQEMLR